MVQAPGFFRVRGEKPRTQILQFPAQRIANWAAADPIRGVASSG